jgi:hypothetical protein
MKIILSLIVIFVLIFSTNAAEYNLSKIKYYTKKYNCTPLWENPKIEQIAGWPWYSDISSLTGREGDFVFLCELKSEPGIFRVVIATDSNRNIWKSCPSHIDIRGIAPPYGLVVRTSKDPDYFHLELSEWFSEEFKTGPKGVKPTEPVIDTSVGGAGDLFYCYKGKWLKLFVD